MVIAIILAAILLISGLIGLKMGVLKMTYAIVCLVLSITASVIFCPVVSTFLTDHLNVDQYVTKNVESIVSKKLGEAGKKGEIEVEKAALRKMKIPASWQKKILKNADENGFNNYGVSTFTELASTIIANNCLKTLIFFILFVAITVLLRLITVAFNILNLLTKLPGVKESNKGTGMLLGIAIGALCIGVVMAFLPSFTQFTWGQKMSEAINSNVFVSFLYRHNLFLWIISML